VYELKKAIEQVIEANSDSSKGEDRNLFIFLVSQKIDYLESVYNAVKAKL